MSTRVLVGDLVVITDETGHFETLPTRSMRYQCVEAIVHMAIGVLESKRGRRTLVDIGTRLVTTRNGSQPPKPHIFNRPMSDMPDWVDFFLRKLRQRFPHVILTLTDGEGMARKKDWGQDLSQYDPQDGADIFLNRVIINNMIHARQQPPELVGSTYNRFKYQMVITLAHELIHCFTGYLTGTAKPLTPRTISLTPYGNRQSGESGRYWESVFLGGVVEFYQDSQDPLGSRQAGIPYLFDDGRGGSRARRISNSYIADFLNGDYEREVRFSSSEAQTTRGSLRGQTSEMTNLRPRAEKDTSPTTSPPRGNTPSSSARAPSSSADDHASQTSSSSSQAHRRMPTYGAGQMASGRPIYHQSRDGNYYYEMPREYYSQERRYR